MANFKLKDGLICVSDDVTPHDQKELEDMISFLEQNPEKLEAIEAALDNIARGELMSEWLPTPSADKQ